MNLLMKFLQWTAWEMTPPAPYGSFHLIFWLTGLPLVTAAAFLLRKTGEKGNRALLFCIGLFLAVAETYKQLFYTFYIGKGVYPLDRLPFYLCSIPMYSCLLLPWLKDGKFRRALYTFTASYGFMGGFVSYFSPESMCLGYWTLTLHSFCWHMLLIFIGEYLFFTGRAGKRVKDFRGAIVVYLSLSAIAFSVNLACFNLPGPDVNLFFLGPKASPLVICRDIVARFGWQINAVVYLSTLTLCAFCFFAASLFLRRVFEKRRSRLS